jgi:hypothetical protein
VRNGVRPASLRAVSRLDPPNCQACIWHPAPAGRPWARLWPEVVGTLRVMALTVPAPTCLEPLSNLRALEA